MTRSTELPGAPGKNTGHGHVYPRPDGSRTRCGGPRICSVCQADLAAKTERETPAAQYDEVEVRAEHDGASTAAFTTAGQPVPEWARYYRHTFSGARRLTEDTARAFGVPVDADPEDAARALATSPGFVRSMMPGTIRIRRRTVTVSQWEEVPLP